MATALFEGVERLTFTFTTSVGHTSQLSSSTLTVITCAKAAVERTTIKSENIFFIYRDLCSKNKINN